MKKRYLIFAILIIIAIVTLFFSFRTNANLTIFLSDPPFSNADSIIIYMSDNSKIKLSFSDIKATKMNITEHGEMTFFKSYIYFKDFTYQRIEVVLSCKRKLIGFIVVTYDFLDSDGKIIGFLLDDESVKKIQEEFNKNQSRTE